MYRGGDKRVVNNAMEVKGYLCKYIAHVHFHVEEHSTGRYVLKSMELKTYYWPPQNMVGAAYS